MTGASLIALLVVTGAAAVTDVRGPVTAGARVEALRGRVWHDDAPLSDGSYRMTCVMEYLGPGGEVTKTLVLEHERTFRGGRMHEALVSARENGKDVTERERRKQQESAADRQGSPARWSVDEALAPPVPFLPRSEGYQYRLVADGMAQTLEYSADTRASGRMATGSVTLDPSDGLPVRHRFVPTPLPRLIRSLATVVRYERVGTVAVPVATETVGEGGLLFIKRRFRVTMTYRDWRLGVPSP
jgi:hypothetical protein